MKRVALGAATLALATGGCGNSAPPDVVLKTPGYTSAYAPAKPKLAFPFGAVVLQNDGREPLTLRDVRVESDPDLRLVNAKVLGPDRRVFMTAGGVHWPGSGITRLKPLGGYMVPPHANVEPYLKLRASAGRHILQRIVVDYSIGGHDYSVERALRFAVCARDPINRHCHVPRPSELD
jgi:hypothetical protein